MRRSDNETSRFVDMHLLLWSIFDTYQPFILDTCQPVAPHATLVLVLIMGREREKYNSEHGSQIYSFIYISFTIELLPTVDEKTYPDQPKEKDNDNDKYVERTHSNIYI